uniref:Uncharacterized protein n=1 Tax=Hordeum vulgare subsp. vulgare TaxID=112509 RepID=A0A8I6XIZ9_HORVV
MGSIKDDNVDIVAVTTNNCNYPIILCRPGKPGAWYPRRGEMPYASIFDVVFYGRKLYGITKSNDLVVMDIDQGDDGIPFVKDMQYVIKHLSGDGDDDDDDDDDDEEEEEEEQDEEEEYEDDEEVLSNDDEEEVEHNEDGSADDEVAMNKLGNKDTDFNIDDHEELSSNEDEDDATDGDYDDGSSILGDSFFEGLIPNILDYRVPDGTKVLACSQNTDFIVTSRHLFESNDKLLMVRRRQCVPMLYRSYNLKVGILEADIDAGVWNARTDSVLGAFFVSKHDSKHVPTYEEAGKKFSHHFVDEHDVGVDSRSRRFSPWDGKPTWFFPQKLAV